MVSKCIPSLCSCNSNKHHSIYIVFCQVLINVVNTKCIKISVEILWTVKMVAHISEESNLIFFRAMALFKTGGWETTE